MSAGSLSGKTLALDKLYLRGVPFVSGNGIPSIQTTSGTGQATLSGPVILAGSAIASTDAGSGTITINGGSVSANTMVLGGGSTSVGDDGGLYDTTLTYAPGAVVYDSTNNWYVCYVAQTVASGTLPSANPTNWELLAPATTSGTGASLLGDATGSVATNTTGQIAVSVSATAQTGVLTSATTMVLPPAGTGAPTSITATGVTAPASGAITLTGTGITFGGAGGADGTITLTATGTSGVGSITATGVTAPATGAITLAGAGGITFSGAGGADGTITITGGGSSGGASPTAWGRVTAPGSGFLADGLICYWVAPTTQPSATASWFIPGVTTNPGAFTGFCACPVKKGTIPTVAGGLTTTTDFSLTGAWAGSGSSQAVALQGPAGVTTAGTVASSTFTWSGASAVPADVDVVWTLWSN